MEGHIAFDKDFERIEAYIKRPKSQYAVRDYILELTSKDLEKEWSEEEISKLYKFVKENGLDIRKLKEIFPLKTKKKIRRKLWDLKLNTDPSFFDVKNE